MWCCKDCIGIIKEDTNATYQEIRVKVEAAAEPLPEVTGVAASTVPTTGESTDHSQAVDFPFEATPALAFFASTSAFASPFATMAASAGVAICIALASSFSCTFFRWIPRSCRALIFWS